MNAAERISLVIPVFNEEDVVPTLIGRLRDTLATLPGGPHEVVFVDDGSTDGTLDRLAAAAAEDPASSSSRCRGTSVTRRRSAPVSTTRAAAPSW